MKRFLFKKLGHLGGWLALLLVFSGCGPSASDVVGAYYRKTSKFSETIRLKSDRTFTQEVSVVGGPKLTTTGTWSLQSKSVRLSSFYLTYEPESQKEMDQPMLVSSTDLVWRGGWLVRSEVGPYAFEKAK